MALHYSGICYRLSRGALLPQDGEDHFRNILKPTCFQASRLVQLAVIVYTYSLEILGSNINRESLIPLMSGLLTCRYFLTQGWCHHWTMTSTFQIVLLFSIASRLHAGRSWVRVSVRAPYISLLRNVQTTSEAHPPSCSVWNWVPSWGKVARSLKVTTHFHLVPKLRRSGATPLLPLNASVRWTGTYLPLIFI